MRREKDLRTLRISKELHIIIKTHCDKNGVKIYKWVEDALAEKLKYEEINNK